MIRAALWLLALAACAAASDTVRIGVFGLFRPVELTVRPAEGEVLVFDTGLALEGTERARVRLSGSVVGIAIGRRTHTAARVRASARNGGAASFLLSVPGKIERTFRGCLEISASGGALVAVVRMEREVAVASAVAAESPPGAPLEALKAQAVVTRSYYAAARGRHAGFDFCDTTHCQFLREPPPADSPASHAVSQTAGIVLAYRGAPFAALFSASCGGRTRSLDEKGSDGGYPYFAVECRYCRQRPPVECSYCRREDGSTAAGHGFGLCQTGAAGMASEGAGFREILQRYFPNTRLVQSR